MEEPVCTLEFIERTKYHGKQCLPTPSLAFSLLFFLFFSLFIPGFLIPFVGYHHSFILIRDPIYPLTPSFQPFLEFWQRFIWGDGPPLGWLGLCWDRYVPCLHFIGQETVLEQGIIWRPEVKNWVHFQIEQIWGTDHKGRKVSTLWL